MNKMIKVYNVLDESSKLSNLKSICEEISKLSILEGAKSVSQCIGHPHIEPLGNGTYKEVYGSNGVYYESNEKIDLTNPSSIFNSVYSLFKGAISENRIEIRIDDLETILNNANATLYLNSMKNKSVKHEEKFYINFNIEELNEKISCEYIVKLSDEVYDKDVAHLYKNDSN